MVRTGVFFVISSNLHEIWKGNFKVLYKYGNKLDAKQVWEEVSKNYKNRDEFLYYHFPMGRLEAERDKENKYWEYTLTLNSKIAIFPVIAKLREIFDIGMHEKHFKIDRNKDEYSCRMLDSGLLK
jgi:hypothetical protein